MNPTIAVAPAPRNIMQDIAPPRSAQPVMTSPAPAPAPAPSAAPSLSIMQETQPAAQTSQQISLTQAPAPAQNVQHLPRTHQAHQAPSRPKSTTPVLVIVLAMVITAALVFAALYTYRQGS